MSNPIIIPVSTCVLLFLILPPNIVEPIIYTFIVTTGFTSAYIYLLYIKNYGYSREDEARLKEVVKLINECALAFKATKKSTDKWLVAVEDKIDKENIRLELIFKQCELLEKKFKVDEKYNI